MLHSTHLWANSFSPLTSTHITCAYLEIRVLPHALIYLFSCPGDSLPGCPTYNSISAYPNLNFCDWTFASLVGGRCNLHPSLWVQFTCLPFLSAHRPWLNLLVLSFELLPLPSTFYWPTPCLFLAGLICTFSLMFQDICTLCDGVLMWLL